MTLKTRFFLSTPARAPSSSATSGRNSRRAQPSSFHKVFGMVSRTRATSLFRWYGWYLRLDWRRGVGIVTGGGTGIGRAICHALAQAGARAVGVNYSRSRDDTEATVRELANYDCEGIALQADVARKDEATAMVTQVVERFHRIDVL